MQTTASVSPCMLSVQKTACRRDCSGAYAYSATLINLNSHAELSIGEKCSDCGFECYTKANDACLMYHENADGFYAEYYGETAGDYFSVYQDQILCAYISETVKSIAYSAFSSSDKLACVVFHPNSHLETIGGRAFYSCSNLTEISIPDSVTSIETSAFNCCSRLNTVTFSKNSQLKSIGDYTFLACYQLKELSIPDTVTSVGRQIVSNTKKNESVSVDNELIYLNKVCLGAKGTLPINSSIVILDGARTIADGAFESQGGLRTVAFPSSLTHIGNYAFNNCPALLTVHSGGNVEYVGAHAFSNTAFYDTCLEDGAFYFDKVLIATNELLSGNYTVRAGTTFLAYQCFYGTTNLTSVILPDSVTTIEHERFRSEIRIVVPTSVTSISGNYHHQIYYKGTKAEFETVNTHNTNYYVYYYSGDTPPLNEWSTGYDDRYWKYGANGEIVIWEYGNN